MTSPKTTTLGILGIVSLLCSVAVQFLDGDALTNPNWGLVVPALLAALTGIAARDNK
jgi:hypothetical protein